MMLRLRAILRRAVDSDSQQPAIWAVTALLAMIFLVALPTVAQEATQSVTFDMVNKIARALYCPVCPNETLDACQTQACAQWRDEIRDQLAAGQNEQEIIDSFVRRYGDRVLGTPQDPGLRALSLLTPFLIAAAALGIGALTFLRWRRRTPAAPASTGAQTPIRDDYRSQIEQDLRD